MENIKIGMFKFNIVSLLPRQYSGDKFYKLYFRQVCPVHLTQAFVHKRLASATVLFRFVGVFVA